MGYYPWLQKKTVIDEGNEQDEKGEEGESKEEGEKKEEQKEEEGEDNGGFVNNSFFIFIYIYILFWNIFNY